MAVGALCLSLGACAEEASSQGTARESPPLIDVAKVSTGPLQRTRTFYGLTRSKARAQLSPAEAGTVLEVMVREGDQVKTGQTLLRIDPGLVRARLKSVRAEKRQIEARRTLAYRQAERFESAGARAVPAAEIDRATSEAEALSAQKDSLEAEEVSARVTLSRHQIAAPFDGVITRRFADPGDYIRPGEQALELVAENQVEVLVSVDAAALAEMDTTTKVVLEHGSQRVPARIIGLVRALDPQTRAAQVRVVPAEVNDWLIPGLAVDATFTFETRDDGFLVPLDALITDRAETRIVLVVEQKAQPVVVQVIRKGAQLARVRAEGLKEGTLVVTRGNERLRRDQKVQVRSP